jgi:hypothetical protein
MRKALGTALLLLGMLTIDGCGDSLAALNRLAIVGSIHEDAPVTTHLQIQIAAPPDKVWALLIDAPSWPKWQKLIENVTAAGPLENGMLLADGWHKHSLTGAAIRARAPSELDGDSDDCQSGPCMGVETRIRQSNSADDERVYGWAIDGEALFLAKARRSRERVAARPQTGC